IVETDDVSNFIHTKIIPLLLWIRITWTNQGDGIGQCCRIIQYLEQRRQAHNWSLTGQVFKELQQDTVIRRKHYCLLSESIYLLDRCRFRYLQKIGTHKIRLEMNHLNICRKPIRFEVFFIK